MSGKVKITGTALIAALALAALGASTASATTHHFESDGSLTHLTGEAKTAQEFIATPTDLRYMKCTAVSLEGTIEGAEVGSVTATPNYSSCGLFEEEKELAALFVQTESCHYVLGGETTKSEHATIQIECDEEGDHIEIKATALKFKCISIPAQTVSGVHYKNTESEGVEDFDVEATIGGITSTTTNSISCPTKSEETETHNNGTIIGTVTVSGHNEAKEPTSIKVAEGSVINAKHHFNGSKDDSLSAEALNSQKIELTTGEEEGFACAGIAIEGEIEATTQTSITALPNYSECGVFEEGEETGTSAEIRVNDCHYTFTGQTTTGNPTEGEHANLEISCPEEKEIEIRVTELNLKCTAIPPQLLEHAVRYENETTGEGGKGHIKALITAHGFESQTVGFACGSGAHTNTSYTGNITLSAPNGLSITST